MLRFESIFLFIMKQLIILLLLIILGVVGYSFYSDWQRYHGPEYGLQPSAEIDVNYHDGDVLYQYYQAIEQANRFAHIQWTAHDIDILHPENDDERTLQAVQKHDQLIARVRQLEDRLIASNNYKKQGFSNTQIAQIELGLLKGLDEAAHVKKTKLLWQVYKESPTPLLLGSRSTLVFEIQRLLIELGYDIPLDGVFAQITRNALKDFELNNGLYPDGQIDALTFSKLLKGLN